MVEETSRSGEFAAFETPLTMTDHAIVKPLNASSPSLLIPISSGRAMTTVLHSVRPSTKQDMRRGLAQAHILAWASGVTPILKIPILTR